MRRCGSGTSSPVPLSVTATSPSPTVPVTVAWGDLDVPMVIARSRQAAERIPDVRATQVFEGTARVFDGERATRVNTAPATRETLGSIRRSEDEAAWRALGRVPDRHERLGLPPETPIVLYHGGLFPDRGIEQLIDAIDRSTAARTPSCTSSKGPPDATPSRRLWPSTHACETALTTWS